MTSIDLTPWEKICCFTYFLTPKLNFSACSKKTSRFSLNRLDYITISMFLWSLKSHKIKVLYCYFNYILEENIIVFHNSFGSRVFTPITQDYCLKLNCQKNNNFRIIHIYKWKRQGGPRMESYYSRTREYATFSKIQGFRKKGEHFYKC